MRFCFFLMAVFVCLNPLSPVLAQPGAVLASTRPIPILAMPPVDKISNVGISPWDKSTFYVWSDSAVFISRSGGHQWAPLFKTRTVGDHVRTVVVDPCRPAGVYVVTDEELWRVEGQKQRQLFRSSTERPTSVSPDPFFPRRIALGTEQGLFLSRDSGSHWQQVSYAAVANSFIRFVQFHPNIPGIVYVVTDESVVTLEPGTGRVIGEYRYEMTVAETDSTDTTGENNSRVVGATNVLFSLDRDEYVYVIAEGEVFFSDNGGSVWRRVSLPRGLNGVLDGLVRSSGEQVLLIGENGMWSANAQMDRCTPYRAAAMPGIRHIALHESLSPRLILSSDAQIYIMDDLPREQFPQSPFGADSVEGMQTMVPAELDAAAAARIIGATDTVPPVHVLHEHAIEYGRLSTDRMKSWEQRSRLRSFVPKIGFDVTKTIGQTIDIDRGSTSEPDTFMYGPDETDIDLGANVSWDIAGLIWNDAETSIEIRERALVDQRDEVLAVIDQLYYELKQLEAELALLPQPDAQVKLTKMVRCEEIRARLDGLTGGAVRAWKERRA